MTKKKAVKRVSKNVLLLFFALLMQGEYPAAGKFEQGLSPFWSMFLYLVVCIGLSSFAYSTGEGVYYIFKPESDSE